MREFSACGVDESRFGSDHALVSLDDPSTDAKRISSFNVMSEAHPEFSGECFNAYRGDGFGHGFVKHGTNHSAMNDALESLAC